MSSRLSLDIRAAEEYEVRKSVSNSSSKHESPLTDNISRAEIVSAKLTLVPYHSV